MIIVEGSMQALVEDGQKFFRTTRIIHVVLTVLMLANGITALVFTIGVNGDAKIPYFFSAFVTSAMHVGFVVICKVCLQYLVKERRMLKHAPTWVNVYTVASSIFVILNVMGIVFVIVNGLCIEGQLCYYDKNEIANRFLAITLSLLHFISIGTSVFLAKKSHLIDSQLSEDITIRVKHSFIWGRKRKISKASSSIDDGLSELSSTGNGIATISGVENSQEGAVIVTTTATSWLDKKRAIITNAPRSKSHPNLRKHLDINQHIEGTTVSIYSDTEEKTVDGTQRRGKKRPSISKRNRISPTKSLRDSPSIASKDSSGLEIIQTQCEIEVNRYPLSVRIVDQTKSQLDSSTLRVHQTGLLSQSHEKISENSALPSVDNIGNTEDCVASDRDSILNQPTPSKNTEQLQSNHEDDSDRLAQQQRGNTQLQEESSTNGQTNVPASGREPVEDTFLSPQPPYYERDNVAL